MSTNFSDKSKEIDANKFEVLSREFEDTINEYIEENSKLKNIIGQQSGKIE